MTIEVNGYPLHPGACAITLTSAGHICLHLPGQRAEQHTVTLTPDENGMRALVHILRRRESAPPETLTIRADMSAPTQLIVDQWLAANKPTATKPTQPPKREITPSEVDELLEGIEL